MNVFHKNIMLAMTLASCLVACGGNMQSYNSGLDEVNSSVSEPLVIDEGVSEKLQVLIAEVNAEEQATEQVYTEISSQEKKIRNINILSTVLSLPFKNTGGSEMNEKLKNPIKEVLIKVLKVVDRAYSIDDSIREKLALISAELDKTIPSHAKALDKIEEIYLKLEDFELRVDEAVERLHDGVDDIIGKIDRKIKTDLITLNPRAFVLKLVKNYFDDLKRDLQARLNL